MTKQCDVGVGLRPTHYSYLLQRPKTSVRFFEAISENYMDTEGRPIHVLEKIREDYPITLHGVALSIGAFEQVNFHYLGRLKKLIERVDPVRVSDHLCWSGLPHSRAHDLLPLPYTEEALYHVVRKVEQVQSFLGRKIALENVSSYIRFKHSEMTEWDFLVEVARRAECKILLDINNIYVNSYNHGFDPKQYLDAIPRKLVDQIHLAGFTDRGSHLFDTHSQPVFPCVWELYAFVLKRMKGVPVLVEWDQDIPEFPVLEQEALKAKEIWNASFKGHTKGFSRDHYGQTQTRF